jgi:hypothetical protein
MSMRLSPMVLVIIGLVVAYFVFVKGKKNDPLKGLMGS